jgi:hypothetical protein
MFFLIVALFVFAYHYERNGNPWNFGDFVSRLAWSAAFGTGYVCLTFPQTNWFLGLWFIVGAFLEILIPHAFAQRMGHRTDSWTTLPVSKWWPAYWFKPFLATTSALEQDFLGMSMVGFIRGFIVFFPPYLIGFTSNCVLPICIVLLWQPVSYVVGYQTPWTLWTNTAKSSTWGEFYIGIGWALALAVSLCSI